MNSLFSLDSPLMRGLTVIADVMILNLLFIVTALPVFTLGAALTALNFTGMRIATDTCSSVSGDYFRAFRQNFRQGSLVALWLALPAAGLAGWSFALPGLALDPLLGVVAMALWYVLAFVLATTALFAFPYLARFEGRTGAVLRNSMLLSGKHLPTSLMALGLITLCVGATIYAPQVMGYGLFWVLAGFGALATLNGRMIARVFTQYTPAADHPAA